MTTTISQYWASRELTSLDGQKFNPNDFRSRLALYKPNLGGGKESLVRAMHTGSEWHLTEQLGKFYLAGPMRGYPLYNFPAFLMATRILTSRGFQIMSPAEKDIEAGLDPSRGLEEQGFDMGAAFQWDVRAVADTVGTILMPGWEKSTGAKLERAIAKMCQKEIYLLDEAFKLVEAPEMDYSLEWTPKFVPKPASPAILDFGERMLES
jgi:hypothetical protein